MLLTNLSPFSVKGTQVFSNGPQNLPKYSPDCPILCNWVFDHFIVADEPFVKDLRSFEACVSFNNNLYSSLFKSPTKFDEMRLLQYYFSFHI